MLEVIGTTSEYFSHFRTARRRFLAACLSVTALLSVSAPAAASSSGNGVSRVLICGQEERPGHRHTDECYELVRGELICTDDSPDHVHGDDCYRWERVLRCGLQEGEGAHRHVESCYRTVTEPITKGENEGSVYDVLAPGETPEPEPEQVDTDFPRPGTIVGSAPGATPAPEEEEGGEEDEDFQRPVPQLSEESGAFSLADFFHLPMGYGAMDPAWAGVVAQWQLQTEKFLGPTSTLPEQMILVFDEKSDPTADVEDEDDWNEMFQDVKLTGNWAKDLVTVAESQLGYTESTKNYALTYEGEIKGYTRYGAWYGIPYGDWCAMFISFCLHYAHVPWSAMPYSCHCVVWTNELDALGLFHRVDDEEDEYEPKPGDLIFFDYDLDKRSDHAGIVVGIDYEAGTIFTIEGNRYDYVEKFELIREDYSIMGYGEMPKNPTGKVAPISTGTGASARKTTVTAQTPVTAKTAETAQLGEAETVKKDTYYPTLSGTPRRTAAVSADQTAEQAQAGQAKEASYSVLDEVIRVKTSKINPTVEQEVIIAPYG